MSQRTRLSSPAVQSSYHIILAGVLFYIAVLLTRDAEMSALEEAVFRAVYGLPGWLYPFFLAITQFGNVIVLFVLALLCMARQRYQLMIRLLMSGLLAYLLSGVAKDLWGRPRPLALLLDVVERDFFVRGPGFPSGHVAMATAIGLTAWYYLPRKYAWVTPAIIIGVAVSRIYLGVHAPLDIVGGFAIGWASVMIFKNVEFKDLSKRRTKKQQQSLER